VKQPTIHVIVVPFGGRLTVKPRAAALQMALDGRAGHGVRRSKSRESHMSPLILLHAHQNMGKHHATLRILTVPSSASSQYRA